MQKGEYRIRTADGVNLFFRYWRSETAKVCLCILHGWGMHSQQYDFLAKYFINNGIHVAAIDLRGHGNSDGKTTKIRKMVEMDRDVETLLQESEKLFPQSTKIILGHQIGALLALQHYLLHKKSPDALILSAPFFKPAVKIYASKWLTIRILSLLFPFLTVDVTRYLGITVSPYNTSQSKPAGIRMGLLLELKKRGQRMITQGYRINIPILVMHGSEDNISLHKSSVVFARNTGFYTTFRSWQGKNHYLTEHEDQEVLEYMLHWIKQCVS